jgi:anti-sigma regulatory factor (Ser/Thr protein kinase)
MEKKFRRDINALGEVFEFVEHYSSTHAIEAAHLFSIQFIIEELFTNMVKYNASDKQSDITIGLHKQDRQITIVLTDYGVDKFDMTRAEDVDTTQSLQERKVGGLGIHLVKKMVDKIHYDYSDRQSTITLTKKLE